MKNNFARWLYAFFGVAVIGIYSAAMMNGSEFRRAKKQFVPQGVRGKQGGAGTIWYRGYHGGK